jgi:hypothetical protein
LGGTKRRSPMLTTRHPVDFPDTRPELEALARWLTEEV